MENLPPVNKCCNCIPLKIAQCFIAIIAILTGGLGLTAIVFYVLFEEAAAEYVGKLPEQSKWPIIGISGFVSGLILIPGLMMLIAPCTRSGHVPLLKMSFLILMCMCLLVLFITISPTLACVLTWFSLLSPKVCMEELLSIEVLLLFGLFVFVFISAWCYYAVAIGNYVNILNNK